MQLEGKSILVTGGTGSFGRAFVRRLLAEGLRRVIVFSRDEWKQWEMQQSDPQFRSPPMRYFLGDVRDQARMRRAFEGVDVVVHAAALKQVPAAEYNPTECVKTNVLGAMHLIEAALDAGVSKVMALSTDKAVNPVNLYGATKLCSDKLFVAANVYAGDRGHPRFSVVRYGNVLGSRGSVLSHWHRLLAEGADELPITHPDMTRFWITLDEAVAFVLQSIGQMQGGEIFVPKCPSMKIADLATAIAPTARHVVTGIRPGEKLHEVLIASEELARTAEYETHFVMQAAPVRIPAQKRYASDANEWWMTAEEMRRLGKK